jgi:diguanylate cyclase
MLESPRASSIVHSTVQLATALDLVVVAEGVEDRATLEALELVGCAQAQGFYIGRPTTPEQVATRVAGEIAALGELPVPVRTALD